MSEKRHPTIVASPYLSVVCEAFGTTIDELCGPTKPTNVTEARAIVVGLLREHAGMSFRDISIAMRRNNHGTMVGHCVRWRDMPSDIRGRFMSNPRLPSPSSTPLYTSAKAHAKSKPRTDEDKMAQRWKPLREPVDPHNSYGCHKPTPLKIAPLPDEPISRLFGRWNQPLAPRGGAESPTRKDSIHEGNAPFPMKAVCATAIMIFAVLSPSLGWLASAVADQPRAITDQHPPRVVNPHERTGPRIASLDSSGWRIVEWELRCVDDACTEVECRPLGYVAGDWSDDGMQFFIETLVGPVAATASEIATAKKACYESTIIGCCGGFTPGLPPCANFCWYAFEAVCGTGGSCYYNCAGTCKSDWGGTCPPPPSWGNPLGWVVDWQT